MRTTVIVGMGLATVTILALAAFAFSRWQERRRVRQVNSWVRDFLVVRYGALPDHLSINGFEDFLCPVVVRFVHPVSGIRHRMQFACPGSVASFQLISEREEPR